MREQGQLKPKHDFSNLSVLIQSDESFLQINEKPGIGVTRSQESIYQFHNPRSRGNPFQIHSYARKSSGNTRLTQHPFAATIFGLRLEIDQQTDIQSAPESLAALLRMRRQEKNARKLAQMLVDHPKVKRVMYPGLLKPGDPQFDVWKKQCTGIGSLISFEVEGGEKGAFRVLDNFEVFRLAVSLGGTESLVEHPMSMTHADVPPDQLQRHGVTPGLIRMSVGLEHLSDLERDLEYALECE